MTQDYGFLSIRNLHYIAAILKYFFVRHLKILSFLLMNDILINAYFKKKFLQKLILKLAAQ
jgi:hypothetical protein